MGSIASQITSLTIVYSVVYSGADQRKHHSSASLAFVRGIHRGPVNSPHKGPVTRKMFPFDDVIMLNRYSDESGLKWCWLHQNNPIFDTVRQFPHTLPPRHNGGQIADDNSKVQCCQCKLVNFDIILVVQVFSLECVAYVHGSSCVVQQPSTLGQPLCC